MSCSETSKFVLALEPLITELFLVLKFMGAPAVESMVSYSMESSLNILAGATDTECYLPWKGLASMVFMAPSSFLAAFLTDESMVADCILT